MNKEKNKIAQFVKDITELFKHNRYQDIYNKFENNPPDLNSFYSLSARVKYIHSVVLRKISQSYQLWFQESSICLSPNYLPYIPNDYFDEWIETFYSVDKEGCEQWLPRDISLKSITNENTFLKADASFSKKIVFEGDPAEIKVSIISTLPKEIRDVSIAVKTLYNTPTETENNSNANNYQNDTKIIMIAEHQSIIPKKRLFFRSSVCLVDQSNNSETFVKITDVILIINSVKLIFSIESSSIKNKGSENPNRSREIRIEQKDIGCSLVANLPPPGFVDVPAPIHFKFSTSDLAGYSIIFSVTCSDDDTFISPNPDMSGEMDNVTINVEKPFIEYHQTFYVFSHIPKEVNLELNWYDQRNGKNGKKTTYLLPLEFHYPFILKAKVFSESSSCRTEVNIQKTPLLTESSYSILTDFISNCPWPVTIKSFEFISENEDHKKEEEYLKKRFSNVNSDDIVFDTKNDNPSIIFQKPIINLPIILEPSDQFSAFTKFSTTKKECKSTNLGFLLIRYFMHSTIYKGIHLYAFKLPSDETPIITKKIDLTPASIPSSKNINSKISNTNNIKKSFPKFITKGNKTAFNRNSCNIPISKNLSTNTNNSNIETTKNNIKMISIEKLKLNVEFDFPSRGSQFEMCELTIKLTNVSETPLEIVLDIKPSNNFLMAGTLSTQIGLFPFDPAELSLKFFPLAHGSLTFPEISINSAQSWDYCYWSAKPTIFISYPVAS